MIFPFLNFFFFFLQYNQLSFDQLFITAVQACVRSCYISTYLPSFFVTVEYIFVFQNIIIEKKSFYGFTIFRDSQLVYLDLKKSIIFRVLRPILFGPYCQLTHYSWATILSCFYLPNDAINYFLKLFP